MAVDTFGITQLYATKSGGRQWFSNWHNSTSRAFRNAEGQQYDFPVTSGQNQDPQDYQYLSMAGGPTAWFIDGQSGIAQWRQEDIPPNPDNNPTCRPYIIDIPPGVNAYDIGTQVPPRLKWQNVEMTCYGRLYGIALVNNSFMRLSVRSNHFNISRCNCDAGGYDFNLLGYPEHAYQTLINKEIVHSIYGNPSDTVNVAQSAFPTGPSYSRFGDVHRFPLLRWIGMKFVVRNITATGRVKLEAYWDLLDGLNGGNWQKLADLTDDGIDGHWGASAPSTRTALDDVWASPSGCGNITPPALCIDTPTHNYNPLWSRAAYSCYIRVERINRVDLKKFSVREIDPL